MLIVAPNATESDNLVRSGDSRSTSASDHSIQPNLGKSREKLNNFADFSAFSDRGRPYLEWQGRAARLGGTGGGKKATDASEGI